MNSHDEPAMKVPMTKPVKITILLALSLMLPLAASAGAIESTFAHKPILLARAGMSLDQAVNQVRKQTGGRILSAKTVSKGGRRFHRIKVLMPSGKVKIIRKPAG